MEIIDRKENLILNRVEIAWQWRHAGAATPTRNQIIDAVVKMEPGATLLTRILCGAKLNPRCFVKAITAALAAI